MDLQLREQEIIHILQGISGLDFVLIGGYAVNAYALPRFSIDCDIVLRDKEIVNKVEEKLSKEGYSIVNTEDYPNYRGQFLRYEKTIEKGFKVSMDILVGKIHDRQTNVVFGAVWIFENSNLQQLKGKTVIDSVRVRIINIDALIVMKFVSARATDIRDVFMLLPKAKDIDWIKSEIGRRTNFKARYCMIKKAVERKSFKDNLQGVFGYVDEGLFAKHLKKLREINM